MRVVIVGAGVSGLSHAFEASALGHDVVVCESADRPGGNIRTERTDGYTVERGPNASVTDAPFRSNVSNSRKIVSPGLTVPKLFIVDLPI